MTTVFGLRHPEVDLAILVADRQMTTLDKETGYPLGGKSLSRKLWRNKGNDFCFGVSGSIDLEMYDFFRGISEDVYDIEGIVKKGYFEELRNLNLKRMGNKVPKIDGLASFVMATKFEEQPKLYTCFPLGSVEERSWTAIGSGKERIFEYMNALNVLAEAKDYAKGVVIGSADIIQIGLEAGRRAQRQDLYSSGLDMMTVDKKSIHDHYRILGDNFERKLNHLKKRYKNLKD